MIRVVQFSGGKDSTALVLWAREQWKDDFLPMFSDTGWEHPMEPNPLYRKGAGRVGCFPCVQVNHGELKRLTETMPEIWDRMAELEAAAAGRTFFPPSYIPERFCTGRDPKTGVRIPRLEDVRAYVTQPNQPDFWDTEERTCVSIYNQCE